MVEELMTKVIEGARGKAREHGLNLSQKAESDIWRMARSLILDYGMSEAEAVEQAFDLHSGVSLPSPHA